MKPDWLSLDPEDIRPVKRGFLEWPPKPVIIHGLQYEATGRCRDCGHRFTAKFFSDGDRNHPWQSEIKCPRGCHEIEPQL